MSHPAFPLVQEAVQFWRLRKAGKRKGLGFLRQKRTDLPPYRFMIYRRHLSASANMREIELHAAFVALLPSKENFPNLDGEY